MRGMRKRDALIQVKLLSINTLAFCLWFLFLMSCFSFEFSSRLSSFFPLIHLPPSFLRFCNLKSGEEIEQLQLCLRQWRQNDESQMLSSLTKVQAPSKIILSSRVSLPVVESLIPFTFLLVSTLFPGRFWTGTTHWPFVRREQVSIPFYVMFVTSVSDGDYYFSICVVCPFLFVLQLPRQEVEGTAGQVLHGLSWTRVCQCLLLVYSGETSKCTSLRWTSSWIGSCEYF